MHPIFLCSQIAVYYDSFESEVTLKTKAVCSVIQLKNAPYLQWVQLYL